MKNVITVIACILILSVFLVQFTANQIAHDSMLYVETQVNAFVEGAKQDGYITAINKQNLKTALATKLGCTEDLIVITGTDTAPVTRGNKIEYSVTYPLKNMIGAATFFGIDEAGNTATRTLSGETTSEYISWE